MYKEELEEIKELDMDLEQEDRFKIDSLDKANWAFKKLKAIEEKEEEIKTFAQTERDRIDAWENKELNAYSHSKEYFEFLLEEYYRTNKEKDKDFRLSTPYGRVSSRKQQPKFIRDDQKLLEWLKESKPELVKIKESPAWGELKKQITIAGDVAVTEDGEIVEGVEVEERDDKINIKIE